MTTKEFQRKVAFYRVFAGAVHLFSETPDPDVFHGIWKVEVIGYDRRITTFISLISQLSFVVSRFADPVKSILIDEFDTFDLHTQLKYFKSFYSNCSEYQRQVLAQDSDLSKILRYVESHKI